MPQNIPLAVALMVVSSLLIAIAATVQHHEVGQQGGSGAKTELSGDQFRSLIRSPRWWLGLAANGAGAVVAIGALMLAPVTITQPLAVLAVPWTVLLTSRLSRQPVSPVTWRAVAITIAGTVGFALLAIWQGPDREEFVETGLITGTIIGYALAAGIALLGRFGPTRLRSLAWASAGAAIFGFEAGVVKALGEYVARGEWRGSVIFWVLAVLVLVGALIGTAFVQQGYATGAAESVVGAVNVVGPLASVVFGVAVLGEGVNYTALGVALMLVSAAVSMSGVALLSRHTSAVPVSAAS